MMLARIISRYESGEEVTHEDLFDVMFEQIDLPPSILDGWDPELHKNRWISAQEIARHAIDYGRQLPRSSLSAPRLVVSYVDGRIKWEVLNENGYDTTFYTDPREGKEGVHFSRLKMELCGYISEEMKNTRSVPYYEWLALLASRILKLDVYEFYYLWNHPYE